MGRKFNTLGFGLGSGFSLRFWNLTKPRPFLRAIFTEPVRETIFVLIEEMFNRIRNLFFFENWVRAWFFEPVKTQPKVLGLGLVMGRDLKIVWVLGSIFLNVWVLGSEL